MRFGFNKTIACKPPTKVEVKQAEYTGGLGGLGMFNQRYALVALDVVIGNGEIPAGWKAYVVPEALKQGWGATIYTVEGQEVILVPTDQVRILETNTLE